MQLFVYAVLDAFFWVFAPWIFQGARLLISEITLTLCEQQFSALL